MKKKILKIGVLAFLVSILFINLTWLVCAIDISSYFDGLTHKSERIATLPGVDWDNNLETSFLPAVMKFIVGGVGWIATTVLLVSGFMMITSFGDSEMREKAKKMLYWSILGIIFIVLAYALVKGITSLQFNQSL